MLFAFADVKLGRVDMVNWLYSVNWVKLSVKDVFEELSDKSSFWNWRDVDSIRLCQRVLGESPA